MAMKFDGEFEIEGVTEEEVWIALTDPYMIKTCLPGCQFISAVDESANVDFEALRSEAPDEDPPTLPDADPEVVAERGFEKGTTYATLIEIGVGSVKPSFRSRFTIDEMELPELRASAEGDAENSSYEMHSGVILTETEDGVAIEWWAEADIFGRIAQMGQRMINPVANKVVNKFFSTFEEQLQELEEDDSTGVTNRIRSIIGSDS
jgi:carbon monoxide dehydrogenase subunit G